MKIFGVEQKEGIYEGNAYNNIHFHGTEPFSNINSAGEKAKEVKVKHRVLSSNFGKELNLKDIQALVGKELSFYYNEHGSVTVVQLETAKNG